MPHGGEVRGAGVPVVVAGQDDVMPAQRGDVSEQARLRQLAPPSQVICGFVHVQGVPVRDRGDDQVQGHDAFLLSVVRPVSDAALGMGEHRARQCVACLALVETRLAFHAQLPIFDPVQHEQRSLDAPDFAEREVEPVLLAIDAELAQHRRWFQRQGFDTRRAPQEIAPVTHLVSKTLTDPSVAPPQTVQLQQWHPPLLV